MTNGPIKVCEGGRPLSYTLEDLTKYHGMGFPGGVAHALKVMERAFPLLAPEGELERREIEIDTSFGGPGGRDAFEMVTRVVSRGQYNVDRQLGDRWRGDGHRDRYFFRIRYRGNSVGLIIKSGLVRDEFIALGTKTDRTPTEERRLTELKQDMADRLLALSAEDVYTAAS